MKSISLIERIGIIVIMIMVLPACATSGATRNFSDEDYSTFIGDDNSYSETEAQATGGVSSGKEAHLKAKQALNKRDIDQALYYYVKALEYDSKDVSALLALANIHAIKENIEPTLLAYRMILDIDENHIEALEGAGLNLLKVSNPQQAKELLVKANELAPGRPKTLMGLAVYYDLVADFDKSREYYLAAAKASPRSVKILNNYGYSRYLAGDWDEAENIYRKLLSVSPNHKQGILNYALLMARKGETEKALHTFKKVMTEAEALNELGYIHMMQQDYEKARRLFEMAISASPTYFERATKNLEQLKVLVSEYTKTGVKTSAKPVVNQ